VPGILSDRQEPVIMMNEELSLLDVSDLAKILKTSRKSIYVRSSQNPGELPPRIKLPGSRVLRWHPQVVRRWLEEQAGITQPVEFSPPPKRRPGRPTKEEELARQRGGAK
jgi:predicted DNA-binding transcriptional regulator AlpA